MILHLHALLAAQLDEMTDTMNAARRRGMDRRQPSFFGTGDLDWHRGLRL
jgi:hypothetical protein